MDLGSLKSSEETPIYCHKSTSSGSDYNNEFVVVFRHFVYITKWVSIAASYYAKGVTYWPFKSLLCPCFASVGQRGCMR